ncbi:hypothetical protein P170DRAFT_431604 [Aspergillus steynii IBT 23096]|uniref:Heterokaryon incompatibility domain-containing protein n=1 Tax=Aspergillus steynii IBT 23096 TaxID=1392250 RepID=A0A2I2GLP5_9EURO|nr:uncharacterized protein P170DRAFT_431604 [Aspergillus steynii IBT 23096]PLB53793.1 hypothetical protein P170DRAFT_431604 [Aspergillus steynii IBT 23096]
MLCQHCQRMFRAPEWAAHHTDTASLRDASANGCAICHPFMQHLVEKYSDPANVFTSPMGYRVYQDEKHAQVLVDLDFTEDGNDVLECQTWMAIPSADVTFNPAIRERQSLPLQDAIAAAKHWLTECREGHDRCPKTPQPAFYPDYLLEIDGSTVRLVSSAEKQISDAYVAVSCCRGANPPTIADIKQLQSGLALTELPIAFREAAHLVQGLFIRYLWIETFCTPPETQTQAQQVYTNCLFNLSLARSTTPNESCLGACPSHAKLPFEIETKGLIGEEGTSAEVTATVVPWDYFERSLYHQPLGRRADSVQEQFWSPRVLSLGLGELFWSCAQLPNASESLPRGPAHLAEEFGLRQKTIPDGSDQEKLEEYWWQALEAYTDGELDRPEAGRLVGVSSIAGQLAPVLDDVYIHGHFAKTLPWSLNWQVEYPPLEEKRGVRRARKGDAQTHDTPSWSWGSMDGTLYFFQLRECTSLADVVDPTSLAETESLKLAIKTFCMQVGWADGKPVIQHEFWKDGEQFHWLNVNLDDERFTPKPGARHLLVALIEDDWLGKWEGLLVEEVKADGEAGPVYQRIGHFIMDRKQGDEEREWKEDYRLMSGERREIILV